jgi:hypothetical protein
LKGKHVSVIAFDGKTLAADSNTLRGGVIYTAKKIRRIKNEPNGNLLVGYSGPTSTAELFYKWAAAGFPEGQCPKDHMEETDLKGGTAIVIREDRSIWFYDHSSSPFTIDTAYGAVGAGCEAAMAAMFLKHTALEAVQAAIAHNVLCGGRIDTIDLLTNTADRNSV